MPSGESIISIVVAMAISILIIPTGSFSEGLNANEESVRGPADIDPYPLGLDIPETEPGYIILCPSEFSDEAAVLAIHRTRMGLPSLVYSIDDIESNVDGDDLQQKVHNFLRYQKERHPSLRWLLILGDSEHLMPRKLWHYAFTRGQPFGDYYYSDVYFGGLDSDWDDDGDGKYGEVYFNGTVEADLNWDLFVGRVPTSNETQASNYISKLIRYETDPPVGTWMSRFLNWGSLMEPPNLETTGYRYYPHKSNAYKVCQRVKGNLPDHLDYKELYDYQQLEGGNYSMYSSMDTLKRSNMLNQFNSGASMLNFVGQARYQAYALNEYGAPYGDGTAYVWNEPMTYLDHQIFTNGDMMPLMYASTCDTAKFFQTGYWEDKSLETWLTSSFGGVIGLISSTNVSARGEEKNRTWGNWYLDEEFWKIFLNSGVTRPGRALFQLKNRYRDRWYSPSMDIKETIMGTLYTYILLGEPYVDIYTDKAERFPVTLEGKLDIYQGNHTLHFTIKDRNGAPVPNAKMTIFSHSTYSTFTANESGVIEGPFDPRGDEIVNITLTGHNTVMSSYTLEILDEISDPSITPGSLDISPLVYDHGDTVNISFMVTNRGGKTAEDVEVRIENSFDQGDNWTLIAMESLGHIGSYESVPYSREVRLLAGDEVIRFTLTTSSKEIDLENNVISVDFSIPGPSLSFEMGSGLIHPRPIVRPGSPVTMDYDVYNEGESWGNLVLQLFMGDPQKGGTPVTDRIMIGRVESHSWSNGTIPFQAPSETGLLYMVMDPEGEYREEMADLPVKSLLEINEAPRIEGNLSLIFLEDSGPERVRLDDKFVDSDNSSSDIRYSYHCETNISLSLVEEDLETYLEVDVPQDWNGNATITVNASDGLGEITTFIDLEVIPVNDAPIVPNAVQGRIQLTLLEDSPFSAVISAYDKEGDPVTFSVDGAPFDLNKTTGVINWTPGQEDVGTEEWTLSVEDQEGGETLIILDVEVTERNDPPVIGPVSDITLEYGEKRSVTLSIRDEESSTLAVTTSHPFAVIGPQYDLILKWDEKWIGTTHVTIDVSDGINTVSTKVNVTMLEPLSEEEDEEGLQLGRILGAAGAAVAVIIILALVFLMMRKSAASRRVEGEKAAADELYEEDLKDIEE